jgi:hypothetical protein
MKYEDGRIRSYVAVISHKQRSGLVLDHTLWSKSALSNLGECSSQDVADDPNVWWLAEQYPARTSISQSSSDEVEFDDYFV